MGRVSLVLAIGLGAIILAILAGGLVLAYWDLPAPSVPVEKVLPDARFPK